MRGRERRRCPARAGRKGFRRGQMLLLFFFFLLAFLPLMALIVDYSLLRLVRRQLQSQANTAALEGMRGKGLSSFDQDRLRLRRERSRAMRLEATPPCELNLENRVEGDLVVGRYVAWGDHREGRDPSHPDYPFDRGDFVIPAELALSDAFLARRRAAPVAEEIPGVSSRLTPVPLIFGNFWPPPLEDVRARGVAVRAAAISQARPAMTVGPPYRTLDPELWGAAPFAMDVAAWRTWAPEAPYRLDVAESRLLAVSQVDANEPIAVVWLRVTRSLAVAHPLGLFQHDAGSGEIPAGEYYLPLYETIDVLDGRLSIPLLVGFGGVSVAEADGETRVVRLPQFVAPNNASAVARNGWQRDLREHLQELAPYQALPSSQRDAAIDDLAGRAWARAADIGANHDGLLAPALVRAVE